MLILTSEGIGITSRGVSVPGADARNRERGVSLPESLLDLIRDRGTATRAELVDETGWGRTVLTQRLDELMETRPISMSSSSR